MSLEKAIFYYEDSQGEEGFFSWEELKEKNLFPDIYCHSLHYGRGVFEGIRAVYGKNPEGLFLITFEEHLRRLAHSSFYMKLLEVKVEKIKERIKELIRRNIKEGFFKPEQGCYLRPLIYTDKSYNKKGERVPGLGVYSQRHLKVLVVGLFPWGDYLKKSPRVRVFEEGISTPVRRVKACGNYDLGGLAKDWAVEEGFDETLITDPSPERYVLEGGGENIFLLRKKKGVLEILTPKEDQGILPGTKRKVLIKMLKNYGWEIKEKEISLKEFMEGEAAVFTGTAAGVVPIKEVFIPEKLEEFFKKQKVFFKENPRQFDLNYVLDGSLNLEEIVREYQRLITGEKVDQRQKELQKKIRTLVEV